MVQSIDHVNIVVENMDAMTAFYEGVLGLTVSKRATISGKWISEIVGLDNPVAHVVYLNAAHPPHIELLKYDTPSAARPLGLGQANTPGLRHIALRVDDIDAVTDKLKSAGVSFFSEPNRVPDDQVTYAGGVRKRLVYFHDPEGNILELCEYRKRSSDA